MKAISLTQPWATLIAIEAKRIETRSWNTSYRGEIAIHASARFPRECRRLIAHEPFRSALKNSFGVTELHTGCIIAIARITGTYKFGEREDIPAGAIEAAFGDFSTGRYGFIIKGVRRLVTPLPCKGALGMWKVKPDLEAMIRHRIVG